jgi:hypothetical protein
VNIVMHHMPAALATVRWHGARRRRGADAGGRSRAAARRLSPQSSQPRPITVSAALTNSRCRAQAESAGQLTGDAWPNPHEAASRQATGGKQNIRLGMSWQPQAP